VSTAWTAPVTLRGSRLLLTPLRLRDAPDFVRALGGPAEAAEVTAHLSFRSPDLAEARRIITTALATADQQPFAQRLARTGELVGTTSFYDIDPGRGTVAIGQTWLGRPYWGTGLNTESKLLMLRHAFETLGAERVVWHTDIRNLRSQAAIERLGATREGVLRHHRRRPDGSLRDTVQYSMVRQEWPDTRERLLARLGCSSGPRNERE
jgi:RimJ/RimL family protein N-acetyltransferase